jgi:hypothetical protein
MISKLIHLWNETFAPREWTTYRDREAMQFRMRRWKNGAWESRAATEEEAIEMAIWQAHA